MPHNQPSASSNATGNLRTSQNGKAAADATARPDAPARRVCFIVDDEVAIRSMMYAALAASDVDLYGFGSVRELTEGWRDQHPHLIFLDIALDRSDAVDAIRLLAKRKFRGAVQIMSGRDQSLQQQVVRVGVQNGLTMLPPLQKPFRASDIQALVLAQFAQDPAGDAAKPAAVEHDFGFGISLAEILRNKWLQFYYQPKMHLQKRSIDGAEVLARCEHPERGVIPPGAFLPDADADSLHQLSKLALTAALKNWGKFAAAGFPLKLAINVSVDDLTKLPIHHMVRELCPKNPRWPGLILEVNEDQAVRDIALTQEIATQLRIHDITLALDDFGSGYSHLARLKELPFAEVKLDRQLVANCGEDAGNASLCQTAIQLAHQFGATVVAEGIEKRSELQALAAMGCDVGQGFLFAPPMPQDKVIVLLRELTRQSAQG